VELLARHDIASPFEQRGGLYKTVQELLKALLRLTAERDAARDKVRGLERLLEQERAQTEAREDEWEAQCREADVRARGRAFHLRAQLLHGLDRLRRYAPARALVLHWRSAQAFSEADYVEDARAGEVEGWRAVQRREGLPESVAAWWQAWGRETDQRTGKPHGHPQTWRFNGGDHTGDVDGGGGGGGVAGSTDGKAEEGPSPPSDRGSVNDVEGGHRDNDDEP
ncbi:MAG: hypothetical protein AAF715_32675, partial [Myxococcota bacterium]